MANPNVMFKRGVHANLPWNNAVDGSFYLTTDTNRLYVANGTQLVDLNKYIKTVSTEADMNKLTNVQLGDFVYINDGNILAVYKTVDGVNKWVQINPDTNTNTDTAVTEAKFARDTAVSDKIKINLTIKQSTTDKITNQVTALDDVVTSFEITQDDFNALIDGAEVGLKITAVEGKVQVATTGTGADATKPINLVGGENVTLSVENSDITIAAEDTTYSVQGAAENKVVLKGSDNSESAVTFVAGTAMGVEVAEGNNPSVTYKHADVASTQTGPSAENVEVVNGTFTAITGVTVNAQGHVTNVAKETFKVTLPEDKNTTNTAVEISAADVIPEGETEAKKGSLTVTITDSDGAKKSGSVTEALYYIVNDQKVYNKDSIEFYTKEEIDGKFNVLNPMVYRGTVSNEDSLPTTGVKVGDTYSVQVAGSYKGYTCEIGDLLIATGTETDGVITSGLEWTYIPAGRDIDTTYDLQIKDTAKGASVVLYNKVTNDDSDAVTLQQGTGIVIDGLNGDVINIAHKEYSAVTPGTPVEKKLETDKDILVVSEIVTENGHVTGINTSKLNLTLPEDKNTTYTHSVDSTNGVKLVLEGSDNSKDPVAFAAGTDLEVDGNTADTITYKHKTYNAVTPTPGAALTPNHGGKFTVVTGMETTNGHLTAVTTQEVTLPTLPEDQNTTYTYAGETTVTAAAEGVANSFTHKTTVAGSDNYSASATLKVSTSSLTIAGDASNVTIDLVWGTF